MKLFKKYKWNRRKKKSHIKTNLLIDINIDQYLLNRENRNYKHGSSK